MPLAVVRPSGIDSVKFVMSFDGVHELWCGLAEVTRPHHPLAPVVEGWQKRPLEIDPDGRETAILTGDLFAWAARHGRLPAPTVLYYPCNENDLPLQPGRIEPETQLCLTDMDPRESAMDLAPAIVLADAAPSDASHRYGRCRRRPDQRPRQPQSAHHDESADRDRPHPGVRSRTGFRIAGHRNWATGAL